MVPPCSCCCLVWCCTCVQDRSHHHHHHHATQNSIDQKVDEREAAEQLHTTKSSSREKEYTQREIKMYRKLKLKPEGTKMSRETSCSRRDQTGIRKLNSIFTAMLPLYFALAFVRSFRMPNVILSISKPDKGTMWIGKKSLFFSVVVVKWTTQSKAGMENQLFFFSWLIQAEYILDMCMLSYHLSLSLSLSCKKSWKTKLQNNIITDIMYIFPLCFYVVVCVGARILSSQKYVALLDQRNICEFSSSIFILPTMFSQFSIQFQRKAALATFQQRLLQDSLLIQPTKWTYYERVS